MKALARLSVLLIVTLTAMGCAPEEAPTMEDVQILRIVASHFAARTDIPSANEQGTLLIWPMTEIVPTMKNPESYFDDVENISERVDPLALQSFFRRNTETVSLAKLHPDSRYHLTTDENREWMASGKVPESIKMEVVLHLPGVSHDGRHALVRVSIPSRHGAWATYVLAKKLSRWKIQSSSVVYNNL